MLPKTIVSITIKIIVETKVAKITIIEKKIEKNLNLRKIKTRTSLSLAKIKIKIVITKSKRLLKQ